MVLVIVKGRHKTNNRVERRLTRLIVVLFLMMKHVSVNRISISISASCKLSDISCCSKSAYIFPVDLAASFIG